MADRQVSIRLASSGGDQVRRELQGIGETGNRSLAQVSEAAAESSRSLQQLSGTARQALALVGTAAKGAGRAMAELGQVLDTGAERWHALELAVAVARRDMTHARIAAAELGLEMGKKPSDGLERSLSAVQRAAMALGIGLGVKEFVAYADASRMLEGRLRLVTASTTELATAQHGLFVIANKSGQAIGGISELYVRLAGASERLGISQHELLAATETIAKTVSLSGASAQATQAALMQFGQGLAAGTLRGEELNSVMEQMTRLARLIADGLGVPIGSLKALAEQGQITSEKIVQALKSQREVIDAEFAKLPQTVSLSLTRLDNVFGEFVSRLDRSSQITTVLAGGVGKISDALQQQEAINATAAVFTRLGTYAGLASDAFGLLLRNVDLLIGGFALLKGAQAAFGVYTSFAAMTTGTVILTRALGTLGITLTATQRTMAGLAAAVTFGNPFGALLAAATAAGAVYVLLASEVTEAQQAQAAHNATLDASRALFVETSSGVARLAEEYAALSDKMREVERTNLGILARKQTEELTALGERATAEISATFDRYADYQVGALMMRSQEFSQLWQAMKDGSVPVADALLRLRALAPQVGDGFSEMVNAMGDAIGTTAKDTATLTAELERTQAALALIEGRATEAQKALLEMGKAAIAPAKALADTLRGIEKTLQDDITKLATDRIAKIQAAEKKSIADLEALRAKGADPGRVDEVIALAHKRASLELAEARKGEIEAAQRQAEANAKVAETLGEELELLYLGDRERTIDQAVRRLSAEATADQVDQVRILAGALFDEKTALEESAQAADARTRQAEANANVVDAIAEELDLLHLTDRERAIEQAVRRLSTEATTEQAAQVRALAGALYDEKAASEAAAKAAEDLRRQQEGDTKILADLSRQRELSALSDRDRAAREAVDRLSPAASPALRGEIARLAEALHDEADAQRAANDRQREGEWVFEQTRTAAERYQQEMARLRELLDAGAISQDTFNRAMDQLSARQSGAAEMFREVWDTALNEVGREIEDFVMTGEFSFKRLEAAIVSSITRMAIQRGIVGPLENAVFGGDGGGGLLSGLFGGEGGLFSGLGTWFTGLFHEGGVIGEQPLAVRPVPATLFADAPRYHGGGIAGAAPWLAADEVPIIARRGELVIPPEKIGRQREPPPVTVVMNITTPDVHSFRASQSQLAAEMARAVTRGRRNL